MCQKQRFEWSIRRASKTDAAALARLHRAAKRPNRRDSVPSEFFVAETYGGIVGCAGVRKCDRVGYLYGLAVEKCWRRRGIGHALTERRLDWLCKEGVGSAFVLAMFWNIRFFKKHGFELANREVKKELIGIHGDFVEDWSSRSTLLVVGLEGSGPAARCFTV
jgi:N-acetylglutamate synthase-like GNAT family acetyltransferase